MPLEFHTSPSQISTYELCPRKWAWRQLDELVAPPNKFAEFGLKVHRYLEKWLKKRVPPSGGPEAKLAQIMIPHLPPPHLVKPRHVEMDVRLKLDDIYFNMALDLFMPSLDPPRIFDHKTTGSLDWALSPEAMSDDVQATLYAAWALVATGASEVLVQWTYGRREAPVVHPVTRVLDRGSIQSRLLKSIESARQMRVIMQSDCSAINVPYDASGCEAFGGCPYQNKCNLTPQDRLESIMAQGNLKEEFINKLRERNRANGVNPPEAAEVSQKGGKLAERLAAKRAVIEEPAPEPEKRKGSSMPTEIETMTEEKSKRGRPRGSKNVSNPSEQWLVCYAAAMATVSADLLLDADLRDEVCGATAMVADIMLQEYQSRFP